MLNRWDEVLSASENERFIREISLLFAHRVTDIELRADLVTAIEGRNFTHLCELELPYSRLHVGDVAAAAQVLAFYKKRSDLDLGIDRSAVARKKFMDSELRCRETNNIFKTWASGRFQFRPDVEEVLFLAQRKIASCLGDVPFLSQLRPRFGPGATTQLPKRTASARSKLGQTFCCSEDFAGYAQAFLEEVPLWAGLTPDGPDSVQVTLEITRGRLDFVPKSAKTDRSIVVEPALNSFFQLGVGDYIADRLLRKGVDIRDQSLNQNLARIGSIDGGLATLDLSSASDSIACELVAHLLPVDWFLLLSTLRTGEIEDEGSVLKLHKFSSMGNGFTFPLETLIFWALAKASTETTGGGIVSVYGDDIIVPVAAVDLLTHALTACGFILNKDKSFWSGPFRESCGKDYFSGILVRPAFVKDRISGESAFILHNFFARLLDQEAAASVLDIVGPELKLFGPDGYGDGHLIGDFEALPYRDHVREKDPNCQWSGYIFDTFSWRGRKSFRPYPGDYVYPSYTTYLNERARCSFDEQFNLFVRLGGATYRRFFGDEARDAVLSSISKLKSDSSPSRGATFGVTLPGRSGFKRISIYTLFL